GLTRHGTHALGFGFARPGEPRNGARRFLPSVGLGLFLHACHLRPVNGYAQNPSKEQRPGGYNARPSFVRRLCGGEIMPVHVWTRVDAGILHHFHHGWIEEIARALNRGLLPPDHYALAEQIAGGLGPDVLTLQRPTNGAPPAGDPVGGIALA